MPKAPGQWDGRAEAAPRHAVERPQRQQLEVIDGAWNETRPARATFPRRRRGSKRRGEARPHRDAGKEMPSRARRDEDRAIQSAAETRSGSGPGEERGTRTSAALRTGAGCHWSGSVRRHAQVGNVGRHGTQPRPRNIRRIRRLQAAEAAPEIRRKRRHGASDEQSHSSRSPRR